MSGVDDQDVDVRVDERGRALQRVARDADRGAAAQPAQRIPHALGCLIAFWMSLTVIRYFGESPAVRSFPVALWRISRLIQRRADRHGDQSLPRHHFRHRARGVGFEPQIAIGQDADEAPFLAPVFGNRRLKCE